MKNSGGPFGPFLARLLCGPKGRPKYESGLSLGPFTYNGW